MDTFLADLKNAVRANRQRWRLVPCGGRRNAYDTFQNARDHAEDGETVVLLVDSEAAVTADTPNEHLRTRRGDGWDLAGVSEDHVHMMVQTVETWIVADPDALTAYYGQGFQANALPARRDLEDEGKAAVTRALERATGRTQKGAYHKIRHAGDLLAVIDPATVRQRCGHCERLFAVLGRAVAGA